MKREMGRTSAVKHFALAATLTLAAAASHADDELDVLNARLERTPSHLVISDATLAAASADANAAQPMSSEKKTETMQFENRWLTANKIHQYLGIGSLLAAVGAGISPKSEDGIHHEFGQAAATLGGLATLTGLGFHYEDLTLKGGMTDPDNWHALLTVLGTIGYAVAVRDAPDSTHSGAGVAGAVLMLGGIKINW